MFYSNNNSMGTFYLETGIGTGPYGP